MFDLVSSNLRLNLRVVSTRGLDSLNYSISNFLPLVTKPFHGIYKERTNVPHPFIYLLTMY